MDVWKQLASVATIKGHTMRQLNPTLYCCDLCGRQIGACSYFTDRMFMMAVLMPCTPETSDPVWNDDPRRRAIVQFVEDNGGFK